MKPTVFVLAFWWVMVACATPQDRFESLILQSREGRDREAWTTASAILADPAEPRLVRARTEMTVALLHMRAKNWDAAQEALDRAKDLGIEEDEGYFRDHLDEYQQWIREAQRTDERSDVPPNHLGRRRSPFWLSRGVRLRGNPGVLRSAQYSKTQGAPAT